MRLCHSRMFLVQLYPREGQEMVFDAHDRAFRFFGGVCRRGIYDNLRTAANAVFIGKERAYNQGFLEMCSHHLVEPVACTPGGDGRRVRWRTRWATPAAACSCPGRAAPLTRRSTPG